MHMDDFVYSLEGLASGRIRFSGRLSPLHVDPWSPWNREDHTRVIPD